MSLLNETAAQQLMNAEATDAQVDNILRANYNQEGLLSVVRGSKLDPYSVQDMQGWCKHSEEIRFTANAQLATPAEKGTTTYSANSVLCIAPNTVEMEVELALSMPLVEGAAVGEVYVFNDFPSIACRESIQVGSNRSNINAAYGQDDRSRQLCRYAERLGATLGGSDNGASAVKDTGTRQGQFVQTSVYPAGGGLDFVLRAIVRPQSTFFDCQKLLPPSTNLQFDNDWTRASLRQVFAGSSAAINAQLDAPTTTMGFRIVNIRCVGYELTRELQEAQDVYVPTSDQLTLGQTNWGELGTVPALLTPGSVAATGDGMPYQFREYFNFLVNPQAGTRINFGPIPNKGKPRRIFIFPYVDNDGEAGAPRARYSWTNTGVNATAINELQVYVGGKVLCEPWRPLDEPGLTYSRVARNLGTGIWRNPHMAPPMLNFDNWRNERTHYVYDLSLTRDELEIEQPDPQSVTITLGKNPGGQNLGINVVLEYDQTLIIRPDRTAVLLSVI